MVVVKDLMYPPQAIDEIHELNDTSRATIVHRLLQVNGIVQGVGFRPFVHLLAGDCELSGWVRNTDGGVEMALQGSEGQLAQFQARLETEAPPLARILSLEIWPLSPVAGEQPGLEIRPSGNGQKTADLANRTLISPDVAVCRDCLGEFTTPDDRRFHYSFTNCTHCGPRYTIIEALPYDRPRTALAQFPLCPACASEFEDDHDRRFHAQATACPDCGPEIWFVPAGSDDALPLPTIFGDEAMKHIGRYLDGGRIVAVKGVGGFHLACRADSETAVQRLRQAKARPHKPLALMVTDEAMAREFCQVNDVESALLTSPEAPIVLLHLKEADDAGRISLLIAPGNESVGVMLPYTPLHHLLLQTVQAPLVMTSGNGPGEPLCIENEAAWDQLRPMCDAFLFHNRPIVRRCDDSVVFTADLAGSAVIQPLRRSRGFVPVPVLLPAGLALVEPLVAVGADLKNVTAVAAERQVFLSQHIGDLEKLAVRAEQGRAIADFEQLFHIQPRTIICDLHPDYASSRYARQRAAAEGLRLIEVQHHQAHIAGCLAENDYNGLAIGLAFDGTGYGSDGRIWGGECLLSGLADFERLYHLEYLPLPGGEAAIRRPSRIAISYLLTLCPHLNIGALLPQTPATEIGFIETMLEQGLNSPLTSSMGRLFDAVSALLGLCQKATFEGQAAMALEAAAWHSSAHGCYYFCIEEGQIRLGRLLGQVAADLLGGASTRNIARRFHNTVAAMAVAMAEAARGKAGSDLPVALSGGVWQNRLLLELTVPLLRQAGFEVLLHHQVPANDGGLAYGQTAIAAAILKETQCA